MCRNSYQRAIHLVYLKENLHLKYQFSPCLPQGENWKKILGLNDVLVLILDTPTSTDGYLLECRLLIEQLAEVNPVHLNEDSRLAFWINLYNALLMHVR